MKILTQGHSYQLDNHANRGEPQTLHFIHKEPLKPAIVEEDGTVTRLQTVRVGTTNEEVLRVLIDRLNFLYTEMPSRETERALGHLSAALMELEARTARRVAAKVEGTTEAAPDEMPPVPIVQETPAA